MTDRQRPDAPHEDGTDEVRAVIRSAGRRSAPPADVTRRVRASLESTWMQYAHGRRRRRHLRRVAVAAAGLLICAVLLVWGVRMGSNLPGTPAPEVATLWSTVGDVVLAPEGEDATPADGRRLVEGTSLKTGSGAGLVVTLDSGATARIDHQTRLRLESATRLQLDRGRIYLDSGLASPSLIVETRLGTIENVGTLFEVAVDAVALRVRVREGSVRVATASQALVVERGTAAEVRSDSSISTYPIETGGPSWEWIHRLAAPPSGDSVSVRELVAWFAREEGLQLRFASDDVLRDAGHVTVHGDIFALPHEERLDLALSTTSFRARREGDVLIIERRAP